MQPSDKSVLTPEERLQISFFLKVSVLTPEERLKLSSLLKAMERKEQALRNLDPMVLDLSIREPAVGSPIGHVLENKLALLNLARKFGFKEILLATFNVSMPEIEQVDDAFCKLLNERKEDLTGTFGFASPGKFSADQKVFNADISMEKLKKYKIPNAIFDLDITKAYVRVEDRDNYLRELAATIKWTHENIRGDNGGAPRVYINYQDGVDAFFEDWEWVARVTKFLATQPIAAILYEDGKGTALPFQIATLTAMIKGLMPPNIKLLVHMHAGNGMENASIMEALLNGADGIWAGFTREAATNGHAPSSELLANLRRLGNQIVEKKYAFKQMVPIAHEMTKINTGEQTQPDVPIIGRNAYRTIHTFFMQDKNQKMDLAPEAIGAKPGWRITMSSDNAVLRNRLNEVRPGTELDDATANRMRALLRSDLMAGKRIAYDEPNNLIDLYVRATTKP